jgi:hypothetical protein
VILLIFLQTSCLIVFDQSWNMFTFKLNRFDHSNTLCFHICDMVTTAIKAILLSLLSLRYSIHTLSRVYQYHSSLGVMFAFTVRILLTYATDNNKNMRADYRKSTRQVLLVDSILTILCTYIILYIYPLCNQSSLWCGSNVSLEHVTLQCESHWSYHNIPTTANHLCNGVDQLNI